MEKETLLEKTQGYVKSHFRKNLPEKLVFHDTGHTESVVKNALEIGKAENFTDEELEILEIAAWFHDVGYTETYSGHEDISKKIAAEFLTGEGYPEEKIEAVKGCIEATRVPQKPENKLQKALADADLSGLAKKSYTKRTLLLKQEIENVHKTKMADKSWYHATLAFLNEHKYHTAYAKENFKKKKQKNIKKIKDLLMEEEIGSAAIKTKIPKADKPPGRGVETMLRNSLRGHLQLSAIADNKANIMLSVNAIIISIVLTTIFPQFHDDRALIIPTAILLLGCVVTIIFATISTIPKVTQGTFTKDDIMNKTANLLFFGNFHNMEMDDFQWGMKEMMNDRDFLYSSMIRDFYYLGKVLNGKYKYLRICYTVFITGIIISVIAFTITFMI